MSNIIDKIQLSGVTYDIGGSGGITSGEVQTMIDESISGKTNQSDFTAHTSNASIHVTTAQTAAWDAKSNFSGSYNDLTDKPTIPTVPTSNTAFTNDAGYITDSALEDLVDYNSFSLHTNDTTIHVSAREKSNWNAKSDFSGSYNDLTNKLSAGTNITIVDNVISAEGGGGKAIEAGRGITVTSGETADTINCTLPISAGTGAYSAMLGQPSSTSDASGSKTITGGQWSKAYSEGGVSIGQINEARGKWAWAIGNGTKTNGKAAFACGDHTLANANYAFSEGTYTTANTQASHAAGYYTSTKNRSEFSIGEYNNSVSASTTFGNSGNTLFSVGNGTSNNARHNAFEIRQNADIYITLNGQDVKLQDKFSSIDTTIGDINTILQSI